MKREKTKKKKSRKTEKYILLLFMVILVIFAGYNAYKLYKGYSEYNKGNYTYDSIKDIAVKSDILNGDEPRIDFDALTKINPDVIGWLTLSGTVVDYPVVKGEDNDYYLNHLYTGEYNSLGTLFVDFRNSYPFNDKITTVYGHSMLNGSMFFILERYKRQDFYEEHKQFFYETKDKNYILEPFAGKIMDAKIPFLQFNFDSDEEFMEYIDEYIRTSTFKSDVTVNKDDKVVMMIKCSADYEDARYVLLCKVSED